MPAYFDAHDERMYQHIADSTGSKAIAAATVNKYRRRKGKTKNARRTRSKPRR